MKRPRPLTKPQRELLLRCRGDGCPVSEIPPHEHRAVNGAVRAHWLVFDWRAGKKSLRITKHGEAKLIEPAPPPPPGRVPCVNPRCWKTEPASRFPGCSTIICVSCFRMVPELRQEYRHLWARYRKVERLARKHDRGATTAMHRLGMQIDTNWRRITEFFTAPEKPEGLDTFLQEMGWDDRDATGA